MARAENFVDAKIDHISFQKDALSFDFANTNTDK